MRSITETGRLDYIINKSKFYSYAYPVFDEEKAKQIIDKIRKEYSDATHVCFAYVLDTPKVEKCSDDGEPAGTAGKPMLELIKKKDLHNVLLIVVRYFGGVKLGAGGLIRAYTTSGKIALDSASITECVLMTKYKVRTTFDNLNKVMASAESAGYRVLTIDYAEPYIVCLSVDECSKVSGIPNTTIEKLGSEYVCQK